MKYMQGSRIVLFDINTIEPKNFGQRPKNRGNIPKNMPSNRNIIGTDQ